MINVVKKIIYIFVVLSPSLTLSAQKSAEEELDGRLGHIRNFEAKFSQRTSDQHQRLISEGSGSFKYKKPDSVRWEIHTPIEQQIIINRGKIWVYDPDLEQVFTDNYIAGISTSPLFTILGTEGKLSSAYSIHRSLDENKNSTFKLTAKKPNEPIRDIEISFMKETLTSLSIRTHDQDSEFFFSNQRVNSKMSNSNFLFKIPPNVDIIDRSILSE